MHTEYLDYAAGDVTCAAYVAYDDDLPSMNSRRPCVLIGHAWAGEGSFERSIAEKIARLGYVAFALDLYGKGIRGEPAADNTALIQPFIENRLLVRQRMSAAVTAAKAHPLVDGLRLGAIGYCFGGLCVLDLARRAEPGVKGVVSFHGMLSAPQLGHQPPMTAKVLILHGYDDPLATPDDLNAVARELSDAHADWQIHAYGHVGHAFALPGNDGADGRFRYDGAADRRSWTAMQHFLAEALA